MIDVTFDQSFGSFIFLSKRPIAVRRGRETIVLVDLQFARFAV